VIVGLRARTAWAMRRMPVWTERRSPLSSRVAGRARVLALPRFSDRDRRLARRLPRCGTRNGTPRRLPPWGPRRTPATGAPPARLAGRNGAKALVAVHDRPRTAPQARAGVPPLPAPRHRVGAGSCAGTRMSPTQRPGVAGHRPRCPRERPRAAHRPSARPRRVDRCGHILARAVRSSPRVASLADAEPKERVRRFPGEPRRRAPAPANHGFRGAFRLALKAP
jgi:hypothetical protein